MNPHTLFMMPTSEEEVLKIIHGLKNKSGDCDDIHAFILILTAPFKVSVLAHIINNAISLGVVSSQFKAAAVCPVFKNRSKQQVSNYRPIALIFNLAKVFEKVFFCKIT